MNCLSCGAEIPVEERFAHLAVCRYCGGANVLDEKVVRLAGKMSALSQTPGPFYVGAAGQIAGRRFRVLGRARYAYANGFWDEWFLLIDDDTAAWVSEDENNFTLEVMNSFESPPVEYAAATPGDRVDLGGQRYHIDEKDVAECEGGEGQLPFVIRAGQRVPYLDMSFGERFATIEYEADGAARIFIGKRLDIADVEVDAPREETAAGPLAAERAAEGARRERVVRRADRMADVKCDACGSPLSPPADGADSVRCTSCGIEIDLALPAVRCPSCGKAEIPIHGGGEAKLTTCSECARRIDLRGPVAIALDAVSKRNRPKTCVKLGQVFRFRGETYRVVGRLRFEEREEGETYVSDEFLLHAKSKGYRYLLLENGHFSICDELHERPDAFEPRIARQRQRFRFLNRGWRVFESCYGKFRVTWVEGELPWVAQVGDASSYCDSISPPYLLSAEWTEAEMEYYLAEYIPREEAAEALGLPLSALPRLEGIAPHQPAELSPVRVQCAWIMAAFAAMFAYLAFSSWTHEGREIGRYSIAPYEYAQEFLTSEFSVTQPETLCRADIDAPVEQSWLYLDIAVIDADDNAILDFSVDLSYYSGVEGGESWSEGGRAASRVFKVAKPGAYRLLVLGQAGRGETPDANPSSAGVTANVRIHEGVAVARYYVAIAIMALLWVAVEMIRRASFEARRWSAVLDDDD